MAPAAATATITPVGGVTVDSTKAMEVVYGTIAIGASPLTYTTHGIAMSFAGFDLIKSSTPPLFVTVVSSSAAGTSPSGYVYQFCPGTSLSNGVLVILTGAAAQSPLTELTGGGAIPAGVSGDTIVFKAEFPRL